MRKLLFRLIKSVFIPLMVATSIIIAGIFAQLQVDHYSQLFVDVFKAQNIKSMAESDIFSLSKNIGHIAGKYHFKCIVAKNKSSVFLRFGPDDCKENWFESSGEINSPTNDIQISYVMQLPPAWYFILIELTILQLVLAIMLYLFSGHFEKKLIKIEKQKAQELISQARQVAHDIRSPLAVIKSQKKSASDELVGKAIERLDQIAQELLGNTKNNRVAVEIISNQIVQEKKLEFPDISIELINTEKNEHNVDEVVFSRIISNLLNNAAHVSSSVFLTINRNEIVIRDIGPGIPSSVLKALNEGVGLSTKNDGNGLGLIHAKKQCERMGLNFAIESSEHGTSIKIQWEQKGSRTACLLEDDELISRMWQIEAKKDDIALSVFRTPNDLWAHLKNKPTPDAIFIDENLSEFERGSDVIKDLYSKGYRELYLCTGHNKEEFISIMKNVKDILGKDYPRHILHNKHLNKSI